MRKKELVYMYISEFNGFFDSEFNFSGKENFYVQLQEDGNIILKMESQDSKLPEDFWGENISNISLLIGDNGSGKTTIMRAICRWVCLFSTGRLPKEKGIVVIKESYDTKDCIKYIAFENEEKLSISIGEECSGLKEISDGKELAAFFLEHKLIYFSNTMTELNLQHFDIFSNYSMPQRIIDANYQELCNENIIVDYKQYEFYKQVDSVLEGDIDITVSYIQIIIQDQTFEDVSKPLPPKYADAVKDIGGLWGGYSKCFDQKCNFAGRELVEKILRAFFCGILDRAIWGKNTGRDHANISVLKSLVDIANHDNKIGNNNGIRDWAKWIKQFMRELLSVFQREKYISNTDLKTAASNINDFIDVLLLYKKEEDIDFLLRSELENEKEKEFVYQINIRENKEKFKWFWHKYKKISFYINNIHFCWSLSSGEQNRLNLLSVFNEISENEKNIWLLLDEPDNTFHPEWSRKLIRKISEVCRKQYNKNFQLWVSTHSPILLSDMPAASVTYLRTERDENRKIKEEVKLNTFGQNIYVLFNDAFFLQDGIIGEFACQKIIDIALSLEELEELLDKRKKSKKMKRKDLAELEQEINDLEKKEMLANLVAEPLFRNQLKSYIENCKSQIKRFS